MIFNSGPIAALGGGQCVCVCVGGQLPSGTTLREPLDPLQEMRSQAELI